MLCHKVSMQVNETPIIHQPRYTAGVQNVDKNQRRDSANNAQANAASATPDKATDRPLSFEGVPDGADPDVVAASVVGAIVVLDDDSESVDDELSVPLVDEGVDVIVPDGDGVVVESNDVVEDVIEMSVVDDGGESGTPAKPGHAPGSGGTPGGPVTPGILQDGPSWHGSPLSVGASPTPNGADETLKPSWLMTTR